MNHIHCLNKEKCRYIAHIDDTDGQIGVVVREGKMEESVRIHRISVIVDMSCAALVIHASLEDNAFIAYKLTPISVLSQHDIDVADQCARDFIKKNFVR